MSNLMEKLEKVHALLINEEHEKAEVLFHEAFVEAAKDIHNEIMEEEDWMSEDLDTDMEVEEDFDLDGANEAVDQEEEFFSEDEFGDEEGDEEGDEDEAATDLEGEFGDEEGDDEGDDEELDDMGDEEMDAEQALADIQAAIDVLQAEFESDMSNDEEGAEEEMMETDEEELDEALAQEAGHFDGTEAGHPDGGKEAGDKRSPGKGMNTGVKDPAPGKKAYMEDEDEDLDDDDEELEEAFDELDESFELESVTQGNTHAQIGTGGEGFSSNEKSNIPQKKLGQREGGEAVNPRAKGKDHKGYDMETPPAVSDMKARKNVRNRSTDEQEGVSKEGDSSAVLNKGNSDGYGAENTKSPIGSKGSVQAKGLTEGRKRKATKSSK